MHGWAGEDWKRGRHMLTGPNRVNSVAAGDDSSSYSLPSPAYSFSKDGRKIRVGDCALFKPPQDSPPFIGLIRWLSSGKENELRLCVNWLYRPSEVKLGKGILLEAAPNEVFYSFHKDEIPAASLLHPCKVTFLAKGVELPSGICSFVCRRVYDITNKCLWWLTDQDYINERQEEVDQLLHKRNIEMHATVQPSGRSPKPMNGPTSTSQSKPSSDSIHNSNSSFPSQVKGKKRDRVDQGSESVKRERSSKMDDGDSCHPRPESIWRSEIAKFTEKGGLVDSEGVEKLVQLMLPERSAKKIDLVGRSILASVIAATDKFDCLNRFVQLRGLTVFDEWLQEVHKGKIGDGSSPKDSDKSIEEFLLVLLRALDKLPVNLHALQMCNIGKSVNHLRTHKNSEIQRKARSLVDTWKKRVEAEMDAKSGSNQAVTWAARHRLPEVSHSGSRHSASSSEIAVKTSAAQVSALKSAPLKLAQGELATKSASAPPGSVKSAPFSASVGNNLKEGQQRNTGSGGVCDPPLATAGDEKSSSSSQSHNNSQSCSSDHAKTGGYSGKEDGRSSIAVSVTTNKIVSGSSRHRRSMNGSPGPTSSGVRKETRSSRNSSLHINPNSEKLVQSSLTCEKVVDVPVAEGNNHKLIVKLSNRGRSPARSVSGGSLDDPSIMTSRASSPVQHDQCDRSLRDKNDTCKANLLSDVNAESWQSNDLKEVLTGSDEGDGSPAALPDDDNSRTADDARKLTEVSKAASSSSGNESKSVKLREASFSSMDVLIESCVKYSEPNISPISGADDVGMNLLASVATGEMSKLEMASPTPSPQRNINEHSCTSGDSRIKSSPGEILVPERGQPVDHEHDKSNRANGPAKSAEGKPVLSSREKLTEVNGHSSMDMQQGLDPCIGSNMKSEDKLICLSSAVLATHTVEKSSNCKEMKALEKKSCNQSNEAVQSVPIEVMGKSFDHEDKAEASEVVGTVAVAGSFPCTSIEIGNELKIPGKTRQKLPTTVHSESSKGDGGEMLRLSDSRNDVIDENVDLVKAEMADDTDSGSPLLQKQKIEANNAGSAVSDHKGDCVESLEGNKGSEQISGSAISQKVSPTVQDPKKIVRSGGSRLTGIEADEMEECTSAVMDTAPLSAGDSNKGVRVEFNLNEGFNVDDGRFGEMNSLRVPECSTGVQLSSQLPLPVASGSSGLPASITVASAAKRPFVPPEDLLKNRVELGWKGSAATSAFRPAEPRKLLELPVSTNNALPDMVAAKASRPPLDIDLNVPDERIHEDMAFRSTILGSASSCDLANNHGLSHESMCSAQVRISGGLDLDLNRVDDPIDMVTSNGYRLDTPLQPIKSLSGGLLRKEMSVHRDFDLNDGPLTDEVILEPSSFGQHIRSTAPAHSQPSVSTLRMNNADIGNFSPWFSQGHPYSAAMHSAFPDRGEQPFPVVTPAGPQRMLAASAVSTPFTPDVYRGPVLSSSPAVQFPSAPFQYPLFSFGNFPLHSTAFTGGSTPYVGSPSGGRICFPAVHSQVLGPHVAVQSHYTRPFVVGLPDNNNNANNNNYHNSGSTESSRKWGRQGLDLNTGPLSPDREGRDEMSLAARQLPVANSQAIAEEQLRMYQAAGGNVLKRKEPDGGWEGFKQSPWQ